MLCKLKNTAARPVSLHLNSGRTVHLPPGLELDLDEVEIANNDMFDKLKEKKLLALVSAAKAVTGQVAAAKEVNPDIEAETPGKVATEASPDTEAETPKKGKIKAT